MNVFQQIYVSNDPHNWQAKIGIIGFGRKMCQFGYFFYLLLVTNWCNN